MNEWIVQLRCRERDVVLTSSLNSEGGRLWKQINEEEDEDGWMKLLWSFNGEFWVLLDHFSLSNGGDDEGE